MIVVLKIEVIRKVKIVDPVTGKTVLETEKRIDPDKDPTISVNSALLRILHVMLGGDDPAGVFTQSNLQGHTVKAPEDNDDYGILFFDNNGNQLEQGTLDYGATTIEWVEDSDYYNINVKRSAQNISGSDVTIDQAALFGYAPNINSGTYGVLVSVTGEGITLADQNIIYYTITIRIAKNITV